MGRGLHGIAASSESRTSEQHRHRSSPIWVYVELSSITTSLATVSASCAAMWWAGSSSKAPPSLRRMALALALRITVQSCWRLCCKAAPAVTPSFGAARPAKRRRVVIPEGPQPPDGSATIGTNKTPWLSHSRAVLRCIFLYSSYARTALFGWLGSRGGAS